MLCGGKCDVYKKNMYRERQIPFDFTYMWNLKNKIHIKKSRPINKEKKVVVARGAVGGSMGKWVKWSGNGGFQLWNQ